MKTILISDELHKKLKRYALDTDSTVKDVVEANLKDIGSSDYKGIVEHKEEVNPEREKKKEKIKKAYSQMDKVLDFKLCKHGYRKDLCFDSKCRK